MRDTVYAEWQRVRSWRILARDRYPGVNPTTLRQFACDPDYEPRSPALRARLGLPVLEYMPVCPTHGVVHLGRCPGDGRPRRRAPRISLPLDPERAAAILRRRLPVDVLARLAELLLANEETG